MARKAPRRTAERILETTLALFNRFGEPNVSTTLISAEMRISPGNLYYHYPAKDELVNALYDRFGHAMQSLLQAADEVRDIEAAWFFLHSLFERIWDYRFVYRDLNDLLSRNRHLETQVQQLLQHKTHAVRNLLAGMRRGGAIRLDGPELDTVATSMVVVLTYWLSFEYVRAPRTALQDEGAQAALLHGAHHVLGLLLPYLESGQRAHFLTLVNAYGGGHPLQ